jgi:hypothetical protein
VPVGPRHLRYNAAGRPGARAAEPIAASFKESAYAPHKGPMGEGARTEGIIELKDGRLKVCSPPMGGKVPKDFSAKEGSGLHLFVLKKQ